MHIVPFFGDQSLDRIGEDDIARLLVRLRRLGRAPKTIRNVAGTLHSLFEFAVRRRWVDANPCKQVDLPAVRPTADIRFLAHHELQSVLERGIPMDERAPLDRALYLTAAMTGLRQGELLALRWRDLDLDAFKLRVRQAFVRGEFKSPKSARGVRGVPMADDVGEALRELRSTTHFSADDDLVFGHPVTGEALDRSQVRKRFQRACRRAGVRPVRFHDLRHTFGTRIAASGEVSLRTLQEWMGHRDPTTTMIYADYQPGEHEAEIGADEAPRLREVSSRARRRRRRPASSSSTPGESVRRRPRRPSPGDRSPNHGDPRGARCRRVPPGGGCPARCR